MKTKIIPSIIGCLLFILITHSSFAQSTMKPREVNQVYAISGASNNNLDSSDNEPVDVTVAVNKKVQKSFAHYFASVTDQKWSMAGKNFHCSFYTNGLLSYVLFNKRGNLIYTIAYGTEKNLPSDVRKIIKSEYYDYIISVAIKVKQNERDIWIVYLRNGINQLTVRVEDGEMEKVQEFAKSK